MARLTKAKIAEAQAFAAACGFEPLPRVAVNAIQVRAGRVLLGLLELAESEALPAGIWSTTSRYAARNGLEANVMPSLMAQLESDDDGTSSAVDIIRWATHIPGEQLHWVWQSYVKSRPGGRGSMELHATIDGVSVVLWQACTRRPADVELIELSQIVDRLNVDDLFGCDHRG